MANILAFDTEMQARIALEAEARKLKYIALKVWRKYLSSYQPKVYVRTRKSQSAIQVGKVKKLNENELGIEITFVNDLVYHNSVFGSSQPKGHSIMLISAGWKVKKGKHKDIYRFGYYEGFDYLGKVQQEYNAIKDKRINLEIQWSGKYLQ